MNDNCKDCSAVKNLEDKLTNIHYLYGELKEQNKEHEKRLAELEINKAENKQKFDMISSSIAGIEKNIEKIANSIEKMQNKGGNTYDKLKYEVLKYIIIAVTAWAVTRIK